jgi:hypothetical protein
MVSYKPGITNDVQIFLPIWFDMKLSIGTLLTFVVLISVGGEKVPSGVIKLEVKKIPHPVINKRQVPDSGDAIVRRAAQEFVDQIDNQKFFYSTNVKIGTPPQTVNLLLDTGSSDTWVFTPTTKLASRGQQPPSSVFDPTKSKTFRANGTTYSIQYGIGSTTGNWGRDTFSIGGANLKSLSIGLAYQSDTSQGIIGIGRPEAEATSKDGKMYENLPLRLAAEGQINSAAYSLYLNDLNAQSGTILFGGVDLNKFSGRLTVLPVTHPKHLGITCQGISSDGRDQRNALTSPQVAVLDSGTSLTYLSSDAMETLYEEFNANPSFSIGEKYYCDCNVTNNLLFNFGATEIAVPAYNFLWPIETVVNKVVATMTFPPNSCYIGLEKVQKGMDFLLLGDNVLRAFYTVYDISNNRIAIAPVNTVSGKSNIKPITRSQIPGT